MTKKLLLADDSVVIQKLVGLSFANENVEIIYTDNGDDAVTRAREVVPDVVLADVVMPGMSGYEVCEKLKQDSALGHIPVLLLTGTFEAFDEARAESAGADGQITKPFEAQALVSRVTDVMNAPATAQPAAAPAATHNDPMASILSATSAPSAAPSISDMPAAQTQTPIIEAEPVDFAFDQTDASQSTPVSDLSEKPPKGRTEESLAAHLGAAPEATFEPDQDPPALPPTYLSPPPLTASPSDLSETENATDPIAALQQELTPAGESDISAFDVDAALALGVPDTEATLFVEEENLSAQTTRSWDEPTSINASETAAAPQDSANSFLPEPEVLYGRRANDLGLGEAVVTNLDEQLATGPSASSNSISAPLLSPFGDEAVEPLDTTDSEMLDIGPISQEGDDLDFGFDVSEQQEATDPGDQLGQSVSSQAGPSSDSEALGSPVRPAPLMSDFDVSSSDLASLPPAHTPQEPEPTPIAETPSAQGRFGPAIALGSDDVDDAPNLADEYAADASGNAEALAQLGAAGIASAGAATAAADAFDQTEPPAAAERVPDLSPMMEQRIQEALEKVAWEAFSDLSESIVKQVMNRVESIAWEVIPQMAETLVREEIRQMKGEEED